VPLFRQSPSNQARRKRGLKLGCFPTVRHFHQPVFRKQPPIRFTRSSMNISTAKNPGPVQARPETTTLSGCRTWVRTPTGIQVRTCKPPHFVSSSHRQRGRQKPGSLYRVGVCYASCG
jgi:hypothetical protein